MTFHSLPFFAFFAVVYASYRVLPHRAQNWLLLVASYAFYASWDWRFPVLLLVSTIVAYACGLLLARFDDDRRRKMVLVLGLGVHLGLLGSFKYFGFFVENIRTVAGLAGWQLDGITLKALLPIGISFYTFIAMSYVIDVYRRQTEACRSVVDVGAFIGFFPTLLAGPIVRASGLLRQIRARRSPSATQAADAVWLLLWGFFKKTYVADNLAHVVAGVFGKGSDAAGLAIAMGAVGFAFQIYGDFSGYSDIARGLSKLLGIEIPVNFRFPYFVRTPQQFWTHWHISLSEWLRDYLFLPLSFAFSRRMDGIRWLGLRDDFWIYASSTMVTMVLAGLWHGAAWTFVMWGAYQGLLLGIFRLVALLRRGRGRRRALAGWRFGWREVPAALGMFVLTCYGWLLFRSDSLAQAADLTGRLFVPGGFSWSSASDVGIQVAVYAGPMLALHLAEAARADLEAIPRAPLVIRYSVYAGLIYALVLFSDFRGSEFLYFQF